ncbi:MAG: hypothetical protein KGI98_15695 [Euryarchaeota archaeon]|nr:hypothetical protein [Euryarchaeota archaeon]MDE1879478.1 hypothetical protein [Euryarchaeota archaeon]
MSAQVPLWVDPNDPDPLLVRWILTALEKDWEREKVMLKLGRVGALAWKVMEAHRALPSWERIRPDRQTVARAWRRAFYMPPSRPGVQLALDGPWGSP